MVNKDYQLFASFQFAVIAQSLGDRAIPRFRHSIPLAGQVNDDKTDGVVDE